MLEKQKTERGNSCRDYKISNDFVQNNMQELAERNEMSFTCQRRERMLCQKCYEQNFVESCFLHQLTEFKQQIKSNLNSQSQINTATRIQNEINQFIKLNLSNIKLAKIQLEETGLILQRSFIIFIKGTEKLEGGIYPFLVTYPANYPFNIIEMRTLFHFYHPHIYPEGKLCIPNINPHSKVQTSNLSDIVQSWYAILHRDINLSSLANVEVNEQYDEDFIKAQAKLFSFSNPIYQKWDLQTYWNQEDQDNQGQLIVQL